MTAEGLEDVRGANREARVVAIAGAGHMIPWENLDDFVSVVDQFMDEATA